MHETLSYIYENDFPVSLIAVSSIYERTPGSSLGKTLWPAIVCCTGMWHCAEGLLSAPLSSRMDEDNSSFPLSKSHWTRMMIDDIYAIKS